jgi:8-oxo-dGTP pyrophosphatase MutT (NUDIX family)
MAMVGTDVLAKPVEAAPDVPSGAQARRQYAALPFRVGASGGVEVLLVTSRTTRRWVIPKGWPMKGAKPAEAAAREAFEEAGVRGKIAHEPMGTYLYRKRADDHKHPAAICRVAVYALRVKRQASKWPEREQRQTCWLTAQEAAARIEDAGLRAIVERLAGAHGKPRG